ncbi:MAG: hypothetical protein JXA99_09840 [Candidatus Lokiarchaeota archaeon]|nr:hypothetical protein [Candidatus Lokiarchaeota archaeon]
MTYTEPNFEIDKKGRVICKEHSNYEFFNDYQNDRVLEKELTCKTCTHFHNDDCFFPRSDIAKIEYDRLKTKRFNCKLCGNKIDRMFTVMHKLLYKEKFNIELPLICCTCYDNLKDNKFIESSKWRSNLFLYNSLYAIYSLVSVLFFIGIYQIKIYYLIFFIIPIIYLFYHNLIKRKELKEGLEYYKKHFLNR